MSPQVVLLTGASSGIGRSCAEHLHAAGHRVVGASRRDDPDAAWSTITMDVTDDDSVAAGIDRVLEEHGRIDAVVACAGWGLAGAVEHTSIPDARAQLETNFFGAVRVVTAALPSLRSSRGKVVLMSSIGGVIAIPFQAYYSASKFALEGWAEALAWEVRPHGVGVTLIEPGNFRTGFTGSRHTVGAAPGEPDPYAEACAKAVALMERDEQEGDDPAKVALALEKVLRARRPPLRVTVGPLDERIGPMAKRLLPYRLFEAAAASSLGV